MAAPTAAEEAPRHPSPSLSLLAGRGGGQLRHGASPAGLGLRARTLEGSLQMAHLRAGRTFDLAGKRNDALAQYRIVLARPDIMDSHDEAKQGLKEPYKRKIEKSTED